MANTVYRKDYQAPSHWIDTVKLEFDLDPTSTLVTSTLHVRPNRDFEHTHYDLELDGEAITLESVSLDDTLLPSDAYTLEKGKLILHNIGQDCDIKIVNRFNPSANTELSGIYVSGENLMSQCESQGFRRITYFMDRPDVLSRYTVTIRANKAQYPVLLSNGNPSEDKPLPEGRHEITWNDPFPKPCYLFALVAGQLECQRERFKLKDGRDVTLEVWVEPRDIDKTSHTMESLKKAIRWDEERFGLELDLDGFRIVATQDFNFGAMENKGLNIFNARYALANPNVATDQDYFNIESVVGHEYFHNWTGDRVTLRDWFQLTLKEGLTVFRDQEFSSDMLGEASARAVNRIKNVIVLRQNQFREDSSPMAHPIRPESYQKIDNFYTATVYEKGAEVIRMLHTLLGEETFMKGFDLYIKHNDGKAVTCEAFLEAMEQASGRDLQQFERWYSQAGTPCVSVTPKFDEASKTLTVLVTQSTPSTPGQPAKEPFLIPFPLAFIDEEGRSLPVQLADESVVPEAGFRMFELTKNEHVWTFKGLEKEPILVLNRDFAAPINLDYRVRVNTTDAKANEAKKNHFLSVLARFAPDPFVRWDSINTLMIDTVVSTMISEKQLRRELPNDVLDKVFESLINDTTISPAYKAVCMSMPSEMVIADTLPLIDPAAVHKARQYVMQHLGGRYAPTLVSLLEELPTSPYSPDKESAGKRALVSTALAYLVSANEMHGTLRASQLAEPGNDLTTRLAALHLVNHTKVSNKKDLLSQALKDWINEPLLINKWFSIIAMGPSLMTEESVLERIAQVIGLSFFSLSNPNNVYSLLSVFFNQNPSEFHRRDGAGYQMWYRMVLETDKINPHVAARLARALENWRRYIPELADKMYLELKALYDERDKLSPGVAEIVEKALNNPV